jgi:uncharacterized protein (DUF169 family)
MMEYSKQNDWFVRTLSLHTPPVAVKYLTEYSEEVEWDLAEGEFYRPKVPLNICQYVGQARYHGRKTIVTPEDQVCKIGALATGAHPFDTEMQRGEIAKNDGARSTPELCQQMFQEMPYIQFRENKAVLFSPLEKMDRRADQIIIYGTPLQILKLIQGYLYDSEPRFTITTCAKYGICLEGMAQAYVTRKPAVGFPCRGERVSSIVQDFEMFICIPVSLLEKVIEGFDKTKHLLPSPMPFGGVDQEPSFLPEYYLTEHTKKRQR